MEVTVVWNFKCTWVILTHLTVLVDSRRQTINNNLQPALELEGLREQEQREVSKGPFPLFFN